MIRSMTTRGTGFRIAFGTDKLVDLSDGQFPVEIWRVHVMADKPPEEEHKRTCKMASTLAKGISKAGAGWRNGALRSWVELRTPASRVSR